MKNKVVYILGAGFSKEAGAPSQEELVKKIFEIAQSYPDEFSKNSINDFKSFLTDTLLIPENLHSSIPLEDIFTPLDRCIADNISFRNLDIKETLKIRELIYYLIGTTMKVILSSATKNYIDIFAKSITKKASIRKNRNYSDEDPVSVISTNWDILLDNSIKDEIESNYYQEAVVDYCCHISSYENGDDSVKPGLEILGLGGFNIKLLKLHGSLNWLQCPRCLRVYVDFHNKIAIEQYLNPVNCRHCNNHFGEYKSHELVSNLIMPTFLKNFSNPQYKLIWQNAGIELSEATKVVFIGYSLPQADFEMRQLLSRMIRKNAEIEVVDYGKQRDRRIAETIRRYNTFFGVRKLKFYLKGAKDYIENHLD
jgi:NAD-dependent SIR2 family protein deacetylase